MSRKQSIGRRIARNEEGTTGVMFALMALPMMALVGAAVDTARVIKSRDTMQGALDTALLAAGKVDATQQAAFVSKFFKANTRTVPGASVSFTTNGDGNLVATATADIQTPFGAIMGKPSVRVLTNNTTRPAKSTLVATDVIPCMHVMDQSGGRTFWLDSNSSVDASGCDVRVRSNSVEGVYESSSSKVKFGIVRVKGASNITSGYSPNKFSIATSPFKVKEGEAIVSDPYSRWVDAVRSQITVGACNASNTNKSNSGNVRPGTYCGTTEFKNATFAPGLYIIASQGSTAGQLKLSGTLNGSAGVSFYLADSKSQFMQYNPAEGSVLEAPKSGLTQGLLFFESSNRGGNYTVTVASCKTHSWKGLIYMPGTNFSFDSLDSWPKFNVSISANQVKFKSWSNMTLEPFAWTPNGSSTPVTWPGEPLTKTQDAAVIQ